jgi:hypothetical protein
MSEALNKYIKGGYRKVDGWLSALALRSTVAVGSLQKRLRIRGAVSEIGVHHGRLFILLHLLTEAPEASVAWDLFEFQNENADDSGRGDKRMLQANLMRHGCDLTRIKINTVNSMTLTAERILADCGGKVRIFSVDGGHSAESTYNDLDIATRSLCEGGVILLDDFFNPDWPGVAEGACRYLHHHQKSLFPVAIVGNKFIFTNTRAMAKIYASALYNRNYGFGCRIKKSLVFGGETLTITPYGAPSGRLFDQTLDTIANSRMWESFRYTAAGRIFKIFLRQIKDV